LTKLTFRAPTIYYIAKSTDECLNSAARTLVIHDAAVFIQQLCGAVDVG